MGSRYRGAANCSGQLACRATPNKHALQLMSVPGLHSQEFIYPSTTCSAFFALAKLAATLLCQALIVTDVADSPKRLFYGHVQLPLSPPNSQRSRLIQTRF